MQGEDVEMDGTDDVQIQDQPEASFGFTE